MNDASDSESKDDEDFRRKVVDDGDLVFTKDWGSNGPGAGNGTESVSRWRDKFYAWSADIGFNGPYETLNAGLKDHDMLLVTSATTGFWSSIMSTDELLKVIETCDDWPPEELEVNGVRCRRKGNRYVRKRTRK